MKPTTPFTKGHNHSPKKASASMLQWFNVLGQETPDGKPKYDEDSIRRIAANPKEALAKRQAAKRWLRVLKDGWSGSTPLAFADTKDVMDRQLGRAPMSVEVTVEAGETVQTLVQQATALIASTPARSLDAVWAVLAAPISRQGPEALEHCRCALLERTDADVVGLVAMIDSLLESRVPVLDAASNLLMEAGDDEV